MITDRYELQEELEKLRQQTFPVLWEEVDTVLNGDLVNDLETILTKISNSGDWVLKRKAASVIEEAISIKLDCDPSFSVSL